MASTRSLQTVANWASTFVGLRPLAGQGGFPGEPALSIANSVLGFILAPPFAWRWNRSRASFSCTLNGTGPLFNQSYSRELVNFGWLEAATYTDGITVWPLQVRLLNEDTTDVGPPTHISAEFDDDAGDITFKLFPIPDQAYTVNAIFQNKVVLLTSLKSVFAPIPDELQYLYNSGFLAWVFENVDDQRFGMEYQKFIRSVIAASEGLNDTQKALFLEEKMAILRDQMNTSLGAQQGKAARGLS